MTFENISLRCNIKGQYYLMVSLKKSSTTNFVAKTTISAFMF